MLQSRHQHTEHSFGEKSYQPPVHRKRVCYEWVLNKYALHLESMHTLVGFLSNSENKRNTERMWNCKGKNRQCVRESQISLWSKEALNTPRSGDSELHLPHKMKVNHLFLELTFIEQLCCIAMLIGAFLGPESLLIWSEVFFTYSWTLGSQRSPLYRKLTTDSRRHLL